MEPGAWVALATVFMLGAMSPGPSLAVVLRNTVAGGRRQGISTGIGHGIGFGIYAFLSAFGIATALSANENVEHFLRWGGISILLWLGYNFIRHAISDNTSNLDHEESEDPSDGAGFIQGPLLRIGVHPG